jgi:putative phosphoesterase
MGEMSKIDPNVGAEYLVGVISDTHGHLSKEAAQALEGVSLIIHAGDMDQIEVLDQLAEIAPVSAVRGNMDYGPGLESLPTTQVDQVGETYIYTIHDLGKLDLDPAAAGFQVVVYGHYHRPEVRWRNGVLYLNPGSATSPRMGTQKSVALLHLNDGNIKTELVNLD